MLLILRMLSTVGDRIIANTHKDPSSGCWVWSKRTVVNGYGRMGDGQGRTVMAHRLAYEYWVGEIPLGLTIDHVCRNKLCCNPAHLEAVTPSENVRRAYKHPPRPPVGEAIPVPRPKAYRREFIAAQRDPHAWLEADL